MELLGNQSLAFSPEAVRFLLRLFLVLKQKIEKQVEKGSVICSEGWRAYPGLAAEGYGHRLVDHSENEYSDGKGNHLSDLEGFWGYLKRKLAAKGRIRKEDYLFSLENTSGDSITGNYL